MRHSILIIDDEKSICTFLALALEDEFDITFSDECVLEIKTVSDLVNYIEKNAD